ncbi:MAG TPA: tripartite tricarboxylate transporter TctB family protein [Casimicrobiaceae bacterium]|nr:tripartite tricarboxylate transporter TctB family protein [Casimicrobiaceae bacterium]
MNVSIRRLEIAVAAALFLLGAFAVWQAALMPFGTVALPGPGMLPMALGVLLMLSSAGLVVAELRAPARIEIVTLGNRHIVLAFVAVVVAGLLFETAGFLVTSTLFMFVLLTALSTLGWWRSLLAAVATSVAAGLFFDKLLGVVLPSLPFVS